MWCGIVRDGALFRYIREASRRQLGRTSVDPGSTFLSEAIRVVKSLQVQKRDQLPMESISGYVETLKKLAADCNFGITVPTSPPVPDIPSTSGSTTPSPSA